MKEKRKVAVKTQAAKSKSRRTPKRKPQNKKETGEDIYYVANTGCGGDCSRIRFKPFVSPRLLSLRPAPPQARRRGIELNAKIGIRDFAYQFFRTIRELNAAGNPVGVIIGMFLDGYGGDEICKAYSENCDCLPNMDNPFEVWRHKIVIPITVEDNGVQYTANFEDTMEIEIVNGNCHESV
jgi:hypothetical protein